MATSAPPLPVLPASLADVSVNLRVLLSEATVRLDRLTRLEVDSVLPLGASISARVEVSVNGHALAEGEMVASGNHRAVLLTEIL